MPGDLKVIELNEGPGANWCTTFNTWDFFNLHKTKSSFYFALNDELTNETIGVCHFTETERGVFKSPYRGTFAGFELKENNIENLISFVTQVEELLKQKGAKKIILSTAPFHHNPTLSTQLFNTLLNAGYQIDSQEINYAIGVDSVELIEKMNRNNKKRLKKCQREGFTFEQVFKKNEFKEVYEILVQNRQSKGNTLSMTFEQIMEMFKLFNSSLYFFKASQNNTAVASSICVKINPQVLYVFYWGDLPGYEQHSPISFVADGVYRFAQQNQFTLLDAGTSTLKGIPNIGLITFKENLGFTESLKLTYSKTIK